MIRSISAILLMTTTAAMSAVPMPDPADYVGLKVLQLDVPDEAAVNLLLDQGLDGLACRPAPGLGPWVVNQDDVAWLDSLGLTYSTIIEDLSAHQFHRNVERLQIRQQAAARGLDSFYLDFRTVDEFMDRLDQISGDHADIVTQINIGQSHEGRDIRGVVINAGGGDKPAVLFNGCQHAREWISPMTTMYIADMLADAYGVDPMVTMLLDRVEVIVIPIINPDGYEYTYAPGGYRFWRKNRRVNGGACDGVDLNRNWGSDWNGGESTSTDPCSDVYVGPSSMSEPEVQALADYCLSHGNIRAQIDFHSFSQLILEPRGYTTVPPPDFDELHALGGLMSDAIFSVHGQNYVHDNPCNILYCASGTLIDWPYDTYGAMAYCIELRPASGDSSGFDPPPSEIVPCAEENFEAALVLIQDAGTPLSIALPEGHPTTVSTTDPTAFAVTITARSENPDIGTAVLRYRADGGAYAEVPLTYLGGDAFEAVLPSFTCDDMPEYYLYVQSELGTAMTYPFTAPVDVLTSIVVSSLEVAFDDDGETNPGWTVSGSAVDGQWNRGVPIGGGDRGDPPADGDGSGQCWLTDNVDGNSDVDSGDTILTSPMFDVPGDQWQLTYWRWFSNDTGAAPNEDIMSIQWSADGSTVWSDLEVVGPSGEGTSGGWIQAGFDLDTSGLFGIEAFQIRVIVSDEGAGSVVEAGFDGVILSKADCVDEDSCAGDLNGDGEVGVDDVLAVIGAFGTTDPAGDADGNGLVDVNDVLLVVGAYGPCE